jgi:hypothetical protein
MALMDDTHLELDFTTIGNVGKKYSSETDHSRPELTPLFDPFDKSRGRVFVHVDPSTVDVFPA